MRDNLVNQMSGMSLDDGHRREQLTKEQYDKMHNIEDKGQGNILTDKKKHMKK